MKINEKHKRTDKINMLRNCCQELWGETWPLREWIKYNKYKEIAMGMTSKLSTETRIYLGPDFRKIN